MKILYLFSADKNLYYYDAIMGVFQFCYEEYMNPGAGSSSMELLCTTSLCSRRLSLISYLLIFCMYRMVILSTKDAAHASQIMYASVR